MASLRAPAACRESLAASVGRVTYVELGEAGKAVNNPVDSPFTEIVVGYVFEPSTDFEPRSMVESHFEFLEVVAPLSHQGDESFRGDFGVAL